MVADIRTKYVDKECMTTHLHDLNLRMINKAMTIAILTAIPGAMAVEDQCEAGCEGEKLKPMQSGNFPWLLTSLVVVLCSIAYLIGWCVGRRKGACQTAAEGPREATTGTKLTQTEEHAEPGSGEPSRSEQRSVGESVPRTERGETQQRQEPVAVPRFEEQRYITREVHRLYEVYTVGELRELLVRRGLGLKSGYTRKEELVENARISSPAEMQVLTQLTNELKDRGIDVKWRARMLASGRDIQEMVRTTAEVVNYLRERLC